MTGNLKFPWKQGKIVVLRNVFSLINSTCKDAKYICK